MEIKFWLNLTVRSRQENPKKTIKMKYCRNINIEVNKSKLNYMMTLLMIITENVS